MYLFTLIGMVVHFALLQVWGAASKCVNPLSDHLKQPVYEDITSAILFPI